jgi:hypothetical protein
MKYLSLLALCFTVTSVYAQLNLPEAKKAAQNHGFHSYSYHTQFEGHKGYGAPIVITSDSGAVFFGGGVNIVKLDKNGQLQWKRFIQPAFDELETQSVIQDQEGNYYAFTLSYNYNQHRGGTERVIHLDKNGNILWDKTLGEYAKMNNPHCSYIHLLDDGRLELRGHIVTERQEKGKDPEYHFWTGWLDNKGGVTQKIGDIINWSDAAWKKFLEAE